MSTGTVERERPKTRTKTIPINLIDENHVALRSVDKKTEKYIGLVDSVRRDGLLNAISVREIKGPNGELRYSLVDGLHRFSAAKDAGLDELPCVIKSLNDGEVLVAQIIANAHKVETKPVEYAKQLQKILVQNPMMTMADLATKLSKSEQWISKMLKLVNLPESIAPLVNEGKIVLSNAHALVELQQYASDELPNYLDRAQTVSPAEFIPTVNQRVKQIKDDLRKGRDPSKANEFVPVILPQKPAALKNEHEKHGMRGRVLEAVSAKTAEEGWDAAIAWSVQMDPISIAVNRQTFEDKKKAQTEERERRKAEREAAANKAAAANTVDATS